MVLNWKLYKLKDVADLATGFPFKSNLYENLGLLKVVRGINVTEGNIRWGGDSRFWNHSIEALKKYLVEIDDIVIGMDGSKIGKNRAIVREDDIPAILAQRVALVRAKPQLAHQKYLWQLINNISFERYIENVKTGTSIPHMSLGQVGDFKIVLPSLPEQRAIASILSALDDKIELNLQMNKTLEEMAMTLYKHWFVDFGPFKDGEFVSSELGEIPKGWEVGELERLFILQRGFDLPNTKRNGGEFPVFAASGRSTNHDEKKVNGPGVVTGRSGVLGKVFFIKEDFWPLNTTLWIKQYNNSSPYHAYFVLSKLKLEEMNSGSAVPTLNRNDVHRIRVIVPSLESVSNFDLLVKSIFDLQFEHYLEINTLVSIRNTLLPKLISGEVRVKDAALNIAEAL